MAEQLPKINVVGDSHAGFFGMSDMLLARAGLADKLGYTIGTRAISAASIMGFRPGKSTLRTKSIVARFAKRSSHLILAFGQVDLELGYYFRRVIKEEEVSPNDFSDALAVIYGDFLKTINTSNCKVALKGVNLTALSPAPFAIDYISRIIANDDDALATEKMGEIESVLLSEDEQNAMHGRFNAKVEAMCAQFGFGYFDLVEQASARDEAGKMLLPSRLADHHKTAKRDHHFADTIDVRRMHYQAAGRIFGFDV